MMQAPNIQGVTKPVFKRNEVVPAPLEKFVFWTRYFARYSAVLQYDESDRSRPLWPRLQPRCPRSA